MADRIQNLIDLALAEDVGTGDITSEAIFSAEQAARAVIVAKQDLVIAGLEVARRVFATVDPAVRWAPAVAEGAPVKKGTEVVRLSGPIRSLLRGERVALNFLQHLSGIATFTAALVRRVEKYGVILLDTRKTTPGLRGPEKAAVRAGGGKNHRLGLYDRFLLKDNHLAAAGSIAQAVAACRQRNPHRLGIEVEARTPEEAREALAAGADILLLDNWTPAALKRFVPEVKGKAKLEASGGITPENLTDYAKTGVDFISMGALTHSAPAVDLSMELTPQASA